MAVPEQVRSAALAAFEERRTDVVVLGLLDDSCTGLMQQRDALPDGVSRTLVFGGPGLLVHANVLHDGPSSDEPAPLLTVRVTTTPAANLAVEVLIPGNEISLQWGPGVPVDVSVPATGPLSLLLSLDDSSGGTRRWQTSWVTL